MEFIEFLKVILLGIIEGITEWLPISSTGHLLLAEQFLMPNVSEEFWGVFLVVIQFGAILAVPLIFWDRLWPVSRNDSEERIRIPVVALWVKIIAACIPAAVIGLLFEDFLDSLFFTEERAPFTVSLMLIIYGIIFIRVEKFKENDKPKFTRLAALPLKTAFIIGLFQLLALIPGTSRSGATIIGALLIGCERAVAAEFSFYLAVPVMAGAGIHKTIKYIRRFGAFTGDEIVLLMVGSIVAFLVSFYVIRSFLSYIRTHDYKPFGYYRIAAGTAMLLYFSLN